jgi:hypothetical protein
MSPHSLQIVLIQALERVVSPPKLETPRSLENLRLKVGGTPPDLVDSPATITI